MLAAVCLGALLLLLAIVLATFRKHPSVPFAGCSSASTSAACQIGSGKAQLEEGLELRKLKRGVIDMPREDLGVGHGTFSDGNVGTLLKGRSYA